MGIVTIADLEAALGSDISTDDEPRVQYYIDTVSAYIESFTGRKFTVQEDKVVIQVADSRGTIEIPDLIDVASVDLRDPWVGTYGGLTYGIYGYGYGFDGVDRIYGLLPYETYRVTCSYGVAEAPREIKGIVTDLVLAGTGLDTSAINGLKSRRVGDVEESYGVSAFDNGLVVTLGTLMTRVLYSYSTSNGTIRT